MHQTTHLKSVATDRLTGWQSPTIEFRIKIQLLHSTVFHAKFYDAITLQYYKHKTQKMVKKIQH